MSGWQEQTRQPAEPGFAGATRGPQGAASGRAVVVAAHPFLNAPARPCCHPECLKRHSYRVHRAFTRGMLLIPQGTVERPPSGGGKGCNVRK